MMDHDQQRDYAEEAFNRRLLETGDGEDDGLEEMKWLEAAVKAEETYPTIGMLTTCMQGMIIGAIIVEGVPTDGPRTHAQLLGECRRLWAMHGSTGWGFEK